MSTKRRIKVAFYEAGQCEGKRQGKLIVSMRKDATNNDLAREIASTLNIQVDQMTMQVDEGFELRGKDGIDTIRDDETVCVLLNIPSSAASMSKTHKLGDSIAETYIQHERPSMSMREEPGRVQLRFVSAELARLHAKATMKNCGEPTNGVLAFNGEYISGNTSLNTIKREAARALGWISDAVMDADSFDEHCEHSKECACSCSIALEVEQSGLFSSLHCRLSIGEVRCSDTRCLYSHVRLQDVGHVDSKLPLHCTICLEALNFPCPSCVSQTQSSGTKLDSFIHCPLIQNAGCGNLHHAHCLGTRKEATRLPCPAGCPAQKCHQEAYLLNAEPEQHLLIIIWDGDNIGRIIIPKDMLQPSTGNNPFVRLSTTNIIKLVESFLERQELAIAGLSLRIHARDPVTETARFIQSTIVSVCNASAHMNHSYKRFPLFQQQKLPPLASQHELWKGYDKHAEFEVDLHTSQTPITACGCTTLKHLFPPTRKNQGPQIIILYAVKRMVSDALATSMPVIISKQAIFIADNAWQPSIKQTPRGMAALLSSLYQFSHSVGQRGAGVEQRILSVLYALSRFPPAVRALGLLFMNKSPQPEDRAALSDTLYHCLKDFSTRGPPAIVGRSDRLFETVRILLGHIISAVDVKPSISSVDAERPLEEASLSCAISQKRLSDPVMMDMLLVNRSLFFLRQPGGELYRPATFSDTPAMTELEDNSDLHCLLSHTQGLLAKSIFVLNISKIVQAPTIFSHSLENMARDFAVAIQLANKTDLVTRDPLELKSTGIVPPQIVLDNEGLLAVFTGRACGSTRDVTFFRPINGGDTEVDVNDIAHSLQTVVPTRVAEDTWQVDSYGGASVISNRLPDEAIVLCLDLSESMNERSGVNKTRPNEMDDEEYDYQNEARKLVDELVKGVSKDEILSKAKTWLEAQDEACHLMWKSYSELVDDDNEDNSDDDSYTYITSSERSYSPEPCHDCSDLISELGEITSREVLRLSHLAESDPIPDERSSMVELAHFASAAMNQHSTVTKFLEQFLDDFQRKQVIGHPPYEMPADLLDPKTGDLLENPVKPKSQITPNETIFVNQDTEEWLDSFQYWPLLRYKTSYTSATQVEEAVAQWIEGHELLPTIANKGKGKMRDNNSITVELQYDGTRTVWHLLTTTTTQTLYALANRASKGKFTYFTIRLSTTKALVTCSSTLTLGLTELADGGIIELSRTVPHGRGTCKVEVQFPYCSEQIVLVPPDASILAVLSFVHARIRVPLANLMLWHGLEDSGDGMRRGALTNEWCPLRVYGGPGEQIQFEYESWRWIPSGAQQEREESRYLSRLDLLKELFNVFLNRAAAFDTSVSLVLGLVTFSDTVEVEQVLTPVFENFRRRLDGIYAEGDTAIYDALDTARRLLVGYRRDLPKLRRRIVIVTDGKDTHSTISATEVCQALQKSGIVVDSVQVGGFSDSTLHAISVATGGYRLAPRTSLSDALSIFDLETMLNSGERPPRPRMPPVYSEVRLQEYGSEYWYPIDVVTVDQFPQRAEHVKLQQAVQPAATSIKSKPTLANDDRTKRIMRELKALVADPHPHIDLYVNDQDISFFKIILEAPEDVEGCPYKGGCFLLTCDFPPGYPRDPPEIRFVTFILHPNVSKQGKVCIAELGRLWSSDITVKELFNLVYGLLLEPDLDNPLEIQASLKYYDDDGTYALAAANAVAEHASKSREEWRAELEDQ